MIETSQGKGNMTTYINFLLDRTGSMQTIRDATIDGFNKFLNGQTGVPVASHLDTTDGKVKKQQAKSG